MTETRAYTILFLSGFIMAGIALWAISHHITTVPQTEVVTGEGCK